MKRRLIVWIVLALTVFLFLRGHFIFLPLRRPDAVIEVKTTGYCPGQKCCGWEFNWFGLPVYAFGPNKGKFKMIGRTASGHMARPGTVAVDPSVFPMGTKFYIPGYGRAIARDIGGKINSRHLDLFFWRHKSGENWGVQTKKVKVWYPRRD